MITRHELRVESAFPSPSWFARGRGARWQASVEADGKIRLNGDTLRFVGEPLPLGTEVEIHIGQQFCAVTLADIERERQELEARRLAEAEADRRRRSALRAKADAFNARIKLPVAWEVAIKDVLSGLSETSWGDGRSRATVEHIRLLEPLEAGRLKRGRGDFLCSPARGNWSNQQADLHHDGDGGHYMPAVSCKCCLRLAERWIEAERPEGDAPSQTDEAQDEPLDQDSTPETERPRGG